MKTYLTHKMKVLAALIISLLFMQVDSLHAQYNPTAAANYADTWWNGFNPAYNDYSPDDCANFVSQCLMAGNLNLSAASSVDNCGCIINCGVMDAFLEPITQYQLLYNSYPSWFTQGDVINFGDEPSDPNNFFEHTVIAATTAPYVDAHTNARYHEPVSFYYPNTGGFTSAYFYHFNTQQVQCVAPGAPTLSTPGNTSCSGVTLDYTVDNYFYWSDNDPTVVGYDFQLSQYPYGTAGGCNGSDNNIVETATCVGTSVYIPAYSLVPGMLYRWNVFAYSDCGNSACSSLSNTLYVQTIPQIETSDALTICSGGSVYMTSTYSLAVASPGSLTYTWYQNGIPVYTGSNYYYTATTSGTYTMAVNYSGSTCCPSGQTVQSGGITVTVNPTPTTPGSITGSTSVCSGSNLTYTVPYESGVNYSWSLPAGWSGSSTTNSITATAGSSGTISVTAGNTCGTSSPSTLYVTVNSPPSVAANANPSSVCTNQQVTFTASGANSYSWNGASGSGSTATKTYSSAGTYTVTVTGNPSGCSASATASVTVNPSPSVSVSPQVTPICANQQATFNANGSGITSYTWSGQGVSGQSGQSVSPNPNYSTSGTYTVTVTVNSSNNCTATASGSITVNPNVTPAVTLSQSQSPICGNGSNSVTITANPTNPGSSPTYSWSNSGGTANGNQYTISNITSSTLVSCTLTSNANCASPSTATNSINLQVTQPVTPAVNISSGVTSLCINSPLTLTETIANGPTGAQPTSIQWYANGNPIGSGSPFTYGGWSNSGSYTITCTIQYGANACVTNTSINSTNSLNITVQTQAPAGLAIQASNSVICQNDVDTFTANPSNGGSSPHYQWMVNGINVGTNSAIFTSSALNNNDIVTCFITSNSSCAVPDTATSTNSVTVTVNPNPSADAGNDTSVCAGSPVILNGTGNGNCSWKPSVGLSDSNSCTPTCTTNTSRIYTLTITSANACTATSHVAISINSGTTPSPNDSITSISNSGNGFIACFKNSSVNATSIHWDFGDTTSSNINSPCHIYRGCGPYIVTLTAYNECGSTADSNSIQFAVSCPTGINEVPIVQNLTIIPNPSSGLFTVNFNVDQEKQVQIQIYDVVGRVIQVEEPVNVNGFYSKQINLSNVAKGVYILQLKESGQTENRKIEIQ
jgi:hypothetical protein